MTPKLRILINKFPFLKAGILEAHFPSKTWIELEWKASPGIYEIDFAAVIGIEQIFRVAQCVNFINVFGVRVFFKKIIEGDFFFYLFRWG